MATSLKENFNPFCASANSNHVNPLSPLHSKNSNTQDFHIDDGQGIDLTTLNKTTKTWKAIANDRLGNTRALHAETLSPLTEKALKDDRKTVEEYIELVDRFTFYLANKAEKPILRVARDHQNNIQGLCCATIQGKMLYIHHVFTAPWNLKMHGKTPEEHQPLFTKGVGTGLITCCYRLGNDQGCNELRLKALSGSLSYYKDYLKMLEDKENSNEFYYPITQDTHTSTVSNDIQWTHSTKGRIHYCLQAEN